MQLMHPWCYKHGSRFAAPGSGGPRLAKARSRPLDESTEQTCERLGGVEPNVPGFCVDLSAPPRQFPAEGSAMKAITVRDRAPGIGGLSLMEMPYPAG